MWLTSIVYDTVLSEKTVIVLLHKHFSSWLNIFFNSIGNFMFVRTLVRANLTLRHMSTILSPFSNWLITSNFSLIPIGFPLFFTWIELDDVDLRFSLKLVKKTMLWKREPHQPRDYTTKVIKPYTWPMTTVTSYSDSLLPKISAATNCLGQFALNRKLSRKRDLPVLCARYRKNRSVYGRDRRLNMSVSNTLLLHNILPS
jgi:hypothetical protein